MKKIKYDYGDPFTRHVNRCLKTYANDMVQLGKCILRYDKKLEQQKRETK